MSDARLPREIEDQIAAHRAALDAEIGGSGAVGRVRDAVLARAAAEPSGDLWAGLQWRRLAAAVLIAGMLGGAVDLALPEATANSPDVAIALYDFEQPLP